MTVAKYQNSLKMSDMINLKDVQHIQSTQVKTGRDTGSGSFSARAQSTAATNAYQSQQQGGGKGQGYRRSALIKSQFTMIDALPYIDKQYEQLREQVDFLIIDELSLPARDSLKTTIHPHVEARFSDTIHDASRSAIAKHEWARVAKGTKSPTLDMSKYQIAEQLKSQASLQDWQEHARLSQAALEHQRLLAMNLELLSKFGSDAYKLAEHQCEQTLTHINEFCNTADRQLLAVNKKRKMEHTKAGLKLKVMEQEWVKLVQSTIQIEAACSSNQMDS